ncbi:conserved domain protein [Mycoplasmoides pneumoniae FH]|uniref:Conserved domain protein n=1 Tax=Mycoplasmoides pneumoniae (strain ATCC 15531 / DSM 23978 / CIP 103766 / NBRC 14401 / NCTC 10119 / FH) TaxID=722438 RepID=A0A0H3DNV5_MYCPB|nr:conserved domain protein [Mycoplasmoides pneumoniae FH]
MEINTFIRLFLPVVGFSFVCSWDLINAYKKPLIAQKSDSFYFLKNIFLRFAIFFRLGRWNLSMERLFWAVF